ncbi:MAG: hypothetical protein LBI86_02320 [Treponema sp.]|jgi:hypothetical protein|nr:hypothetical protein [Treponema sp.]
MNKRINFEDNLFALAMRIQMIRDLFALDADPELFLEKTMDDIDFIDCTLGVLLRELTENSRLLERDEAFENLSELEWRFDQALGEMYSGGGGISAASYPMLRERVALVKSRSLERRKTADASLSGSPSSEPLVSIDELSELLKDM